MEPQPISVTSASAGPIKHRRLDGCLDAGDLPLALFHHLAALGGVGELVADEYAILHMFIRRGRVVVAGNAGNGSRRNAALGEQVALVAIGAVGPLLRSREVISSPRSISTLKSRSVGIDTHGSLRTAAGR